jgi:hypothetical protein
MPRRFWTPRKGEKQEAAPEVRADIQRRPHLVEKPSLPAAAASTPARYLIPTDARVCWIGRFSDGTLLPPRGPEAWTGHANFVCGCFRCAPWLYCEPCAARGMANLRAAPNADFPEPGALCRECLYAPVREALARNTEEVLRLFNSAWPGPVPAPGKREFPRHDPRARRKGE